MLFGDITGTLVYFGNGFHVVPTMKLGDNAEVASMLSKLITAVYYYRSCHVMSGYH